MYINKIYRKWTKDEIFDDFIPGFYFIRMGFYKRFKIIKLMYSFDSTMTYSHETGRINHLSLLDENAILYGPIQEPIE